MNDKPAMQTPGEKLSGLRLAAGRSLEDLAEATKIPPPMLQAIELDEYHKISGELYVKSFLRAYASEMGVEDEEILNLYGNFTGAVSTPTDEEGAPVWQEEEVQIKRLGLPWLTIGLIVVGVIVLAVAGFFLVRALGGGDDSPQTPVRTEPTQQAPDSTARAGATEAAYHDSLPVDEPRVAREVPAEKPQAKPSAAIGKPVTARPEPVTARPEPVDSSRGLPEAVAGRPGQLQIDGRTWPVVLRIIFPGEREAALKKDGDRRYSEVDWPTKDRPLPAAGVRAGQAYQVKEGLAVYWGAEDHFSLKLDDPSGCRATVNGQYRDVSGLSPGEEIILNDPDVIRSNLPSARSADRP